MTPTAPMVAPPLHVGMFDKKNIHDRSIPAAVEYFVEYYWQRAIVRCDF